MAVFRKTQWLLVILCGVFLSMFCLIVGIALESPSFIDPLERRKAEIQLTKQTAIYAHQVTQDCLNFFGYLVRDDRPGGTIAAHPAVGIKRFGVEFVQAKEEHPYLIFRFCDPRFPSGKAAIYGLEDIEWKACSRENTGMTAKVTFLQWLPKKDKVKSRIDVTLRDLTLAGIAWKTHSSYAHFEVPVSGNGRMAVPNAN